MPYPDHREDLESRTSTPQGIYVLDPPGYWGKPQALNPKPVVVSTGGGFSEVWFFRWVSPNSERFT